MIQVLFIGCYRNNTDSTPLHLAAATGHSEVVAYLLRQPGIRLVQVGPQWYSLVLHGQQ